MNTYAIVLKNSFRHCCLWAGALFLTIPAVFAQPAAIKWFREVKTPRDQHTLSLLNAKASGFQLLRWQDSRTDAEGKRTPAMPLLTVLGPGGERMYDDPLPGFDSGPLDFRFAVANDSVLLVVYESPNSAGTQTLFARRLNLNTRKWSNEPQSIFTEATGRAPAFSNAWYARSSTDRQTCIYRVQYGNPSHIETALLDEDFQVIRQGAVELPAPAGQMALRQVFCTDDGEILAHFQIFNSGSKSVGRPFEGSPGVFSSNGHALYRKADWASEAPPYSDVIFLLPTAGQGETADFYPRIGRKFTPSFEISQGPDGRLYCAGLYSDLDNKQVEGYFVYAIDPRTREAQILQNATLPSSVRKALLNEKAAAKKAPVKDLALRWLRWTDDGRPWLLAERQNFDMSPGRMDEAVLLRLDSTYRIGGARKIEKYQRLPTGDPQNFASMAACPAPKNGWWLLWNQGNWPNAKLILTDCGAGGSPTDHTLDASSRSNVSLLPQTMLYRENKWYFVGESEYHERIRVGVLEEK